MTTSDAAPGSMEDQHRKKKRLGILAFLDTDEIVVRSAFQTGDCEVEGT